MLKILCWILYGLIVGSIARFLHPGKEPQGCLVTIGIGVAGSFVGGGINWLLDFGGPYSPSGVLMGVLGGVVFCYGWNYYLSKYAK